MIGKNPVTGKKIVLDGINGFALYNISTKSIHFQSENGLALIVVLQK
jgi:hypothetical protein